MSSQLVEWSAPRGGSGGSVPILPIAAEEARRRPVVLAAVFALVALTMLAFGLSTPKRFTSSTTMLVEDSNIIAPLMEGRAVPTTVVDRAAIAREVAFSRKVMNQILAAGGWLKENPDPLERERLINQIAERTEISNPRENLNLIRISYSDSDPQRALVVTRRFAELIMEESSLAKQVESREAYEFIDSQVGQYRTMLADAEQKLADYRQIHPDARPGSEEEVNARIAELRNEIDRSRMELVDQSSQAGAMRSHLSREARLGPAGAQDSQNRSRLLALQAERDSLLSRYTDQHPDVVRVQQQIEDLQRSGGSRSGATVARSTAASAYDPAYSDIRTRMADASSRSAASASRVALGQTLLAQELERSNRIAASAGELGGLTRDFEVSRNLYQDLLDRRENARMSMNLDAQNGGLNFRVQEPASLPLQATGVRLMHIALAGLVLAVAIPLVLLLAWVRYDSRVRSPIQIENIAGLPVLGSIPMRRTSTGGAIGQSRKLTLAAALVLAVPLAYALALSLR
ncbi:MAG: hypothetical protein M3Q42_13110 [Pseudomonadota bacterium]|nr:hypothetical protein [Pseudomonadota bacterium]